MTGASRRRRDGRRWIYVTIAMMVFSLCAVFVALMTQLEPASIEEISASTEESWGRFLLELFAPKREIPTADCVVALQDLADELTDHYDVEPVHVSVALSPVVNAISLPDRRIVIFDGLLEDIESENEIVMILAHEIGHHEANHIVEAIQRRTLLTLAASGVGQIPVLGPILIQLGDLGELSFSRDAEHEADTIALDLLNLHYGHVGGCVNFFERQLERSEEFAATEFLSTHPLSRKRIEQIGEQARAEGWSYGETSAPPQDCDDAFEFEAD